MSKPVILGWLMLVSGLAFLVVRHDRGHEHDMAIPAVTNSPATRVAATNTTLAGVIPLVTNDSTSVTGSGLPTATFSWFQAHPFKEVKSAGGFSWTAEDGKDTNIIRELAHNELEYQRMVNENGTIYRRQLVYHPAGFTLQAQHAAQSGQGIQQLTLPGLDGQELAVAVTKTDFESGGDKGLVYGTLAGDPDSMVTVAFINGWESFTVVSRRIQVFLHAEAREPGEMVVKQIDPNTYGTGVCGNQ